MEKVSSVEGQLFGSRPTQDETVVVDIEEPAIPAVTQSVIEVEPASEPLMIKVIDNGNDKTEGKYCTYFLIQNFFQARAESRVSSAPSKQIFALLSDSILLCKKQNISKYIKII